MDILIIFILILLLLNFLLFEGDFVNPSFLYMFFFFISIVYVYFYNLNIQFYSDNIFYLVAISILGFFLGTLLLKKNIEYNMNFKIYDIEKYKLVIFLLFELIYLCLVMYDMYTNTSSLAISDKIGEYYELKRYKLIVSNNIIKIISILNTSITYFMIYILLIYKNYNLKNTKYNIILMGIILSFISSYITGTRTEIFMYIISFIIIKNIINRNMNLHSKVIVFLKYLLSLILMGILFNITYFTQGRIVSELTVSEVFFTYLGAPLKNLDIILDNSSIYYSDFFGKYTFINTYNWIYELTGYSYFHYSGIYDYRWYNGIALGNVSTMLASIYLDFGFVGVFILSFIIGTISQHFYNKVNTKNYIYIIFYSYISFAIIFSFFSNKFFEMIIARAGLYFIFGVYISYIFFVKIKIRFK